MQQRYVVRQVHLQFFQCRDTSGFGVLKAFLVRSQHSTIWQNRDCRAPSSLCNAPAGCRSAAARTHTVPAWAGQGAGSQRVSSASCQHIHTRRRQTENPKHNEKLKISGNKSISEVVLSQHFSFGLLRISFPTQFCNCILNATGRASFLYYAEIAMALITPLHGLTYTGK